MGLWRLCICTCMHRVCLCWGTEIHADGQNTHHHHQAIPWVIESRGHLRPRLSWSVTLNLSTETSLKHEKLRYDCVQESRFFTACAHCRSSLVNIGSGGTWVCRNHASLQHVHIAPVTPECLQALQSQKSLLSLSMAGGGEHLGRKGMRLPWSTPALPGTADRQFQQGHPSLLLSPCVIPIRRSTLPVLLESVTYGGRAALTDYDTWNA
jgi:hypothetical protein